VNEELIQKLVDKCVDKRERHGRTVEVLQSRKFAELIVRECASVVFKKTGPKSALDVLEHFGVEE
jgi:hypothetical protein